MFMEMLQVLNFSWQQYFSSIFFKG